MGGVNRIWRHNFEFYVQGGANACESAFSLHKCSFDTLPTVKTTIILILPKAPLRFFSRICCIPQLPWTSSPSIGQIITPPYPLSLIY
ncbi:hypothetical protein NQ317_005965 [Molorchus minor]|uniref:Uncharacterized protein n=1 Tax=Molorchus minor TaxID=1323400 RepID=A0ABQ9IW41_9CUCU|nr:hypothetical protein NQ317_005965 [Molorchus minor]